MPTLSIAERTCLHQRQEPVIAHPRVLIADPDEALLEAYAEYFDSQFWDLKTAMSGLDCVAKLRSFKPDVLVLEPELPWGGGSGVLTQLREDADLASVLVIVVTTGRESDELSLVSHFMLDALLLKPVNVETLVKRIHTLMAVTRVPR